MKKWSKTALVTLLCFAGSVSSATTNINLLLGAAFSKLSNAQFISPQTGIINSYASNEQVQTRPFYGLGAEYNFDHTVAQPISLSLGLSFYYMGKSHITGVETQGINITPLPIDPLSYSMQTQNVALLLEPKIVYPAPHLQPYVFGGLGYARNTLSHFSESRLPGSFATPSDYPYSNHTQTKFAYEGGIGVQYVVREYKDNHAILCHLEYRFFNLGQSRLGMAATQTTNQYITVKNTSNIIDFGITYRL